jgi:hypothetical protein
MSSGETTHLKKVPMEKVFFKMLPKLVIQIYYNNLLKIIYTHYILYLVSAI